MMANAHALLQGGTADDESEYSASEEESSEDDSEGEVEDEDDPSEDGSGSDGEFAGAKAMKQGRTRKRSAAKGRKARKVAKAAMARVVATKQGGVAFQTQMDHAAALETIEAQGVPCEGGQPQLEELPVHMAQRMLTLSAHPDKLPCRDHEKEVQDSDSCSVRRLCPVL